MKIITILWTISIMLTSGLAAIMVLATLACRGACS